MTDTNPTPDHFLFKTINKDRVKHYETIRLRGLKLFKSGWISEGYTSRDLHFDLNGSLFYFVGEEIIHLDAHNGNYVVEFERTLSDNEKHLLHLCWELHRTKSKLFICDPSEQ